ncbi:hypothetical protein BS418_22325, partial [Cronobacter sakazakii]
RVGGWELCIGEGGGWGGLGWFGGGRCVGFWGGGGFVGKGGFVGGGGCAALPPPNNIKHHVFAGGG